MFREEALWIENALKKIKPLSNNNKVANLGSSTKYFREVIQPHIHQHIIQTLFNNNWQVINIDIKADEGVDIVADVTQNSILHTVPSSALTICTNMLEHVLDIPMVIKHLIGITTINGYILITVPYKYKKHLDPIDNMFRPTPNQIIELFKNYSIKVVDKGIITIYDKNYYTPKKSHYPLWGYREMIGYYLGKKHKVSGVLIQKLA